MLNWLKSLFSGPKPAGPPQVLRAFAPDRAFLEMWCRLPGQGEFFSKGFHHAVAGTVNWAHYKIHYKIPFYLERGQKPDLIKLNLAVEGSGTLWLRNIQLLKTPLAS